MINNGNAKIGKFFNGLNISIPSKKNWFGLLFGTAWLGGWYLGFTSASSTLSSETEHGVADGFLTVWLIGWTIGGIAMVIVLLWGFFGQEKVVVATDEVLFEKSIFGIGQKRRLQTVEIKNIRTEIGNDKWFGGNRWAFWGLGDGKIKFDYGLKTFSFGLGVDDAEANHITTLLKEYFKN